ARVTLTGSVVNLLLVGMKAVAGIVGHSAAMISDAVHSLSDFVTDIVVLVFVRVSARPQAVCEAGGGGIGFYKKRHRAFALKNSVSFFSEFQWWFRIRPRCLLVALLPSRQ
ncbi:MAG: cation transporter, partial [Bacteroidales bacterium]|nr:cation transporter [Bacteroidales bacterium]